MRRYFTPDTQRRLAPIVLVGGLLLSGKLAYDAVPRSRQVKLVPTEDQRARVRAIRVLYLLDQEAVAGLDRRFPEGMPPEFSHEPTLAPGEYEIQVELTTARGETWRVQRPVSVGSEEVFRIALAGAR